MDLSVVELLWYSSQLHIVAEHQAKVRSGVRTSTLQGGQRGAAAETAVVVCPGEMDDF